MADENAVGESDGYGTNLSNSSASIKSTRAGYLTSGGAKIGGGNIKKSVKAARVFDYLTPAAKKAFNHLWHAFTKALIFQYFDPKWHIQIKTNALDYIFSRALN